MTDDSITKKFQIPLISLATTINRDQNLINHFEDLSNELIYEIFEFLDSYHIYEAFLDLNTRFQNLCIHSNLPININISSLSKSTFQRYYTQLIMPKKHRIQSLCLSDPFIIDFFSSSTEHLSKCSQLRTLILDIFESEHMENLLHSLASLPNLSSLAIPIAQGSNTNTIYNLIFQLPVLKYCKITFEENVFFESLPRSTKKASNSIEHLVINGACHYVIIDALLSYVPQLRRLSINYLYGYYKHGINEFSTILNNLTHVSLTLKDLLFDQFEPFIEQYLSRVKVLYISSNYDTAYLNATRWKQIILSHMPHLHIFDFQHKYELFYRNKYENIYLHLFQKFTSSFWLERQWFFTYDNNFGSPPYGIFYSIKPYRRKYFTLTDEPNLDKNTCHEKTIFDSVHHVTIQDERVIAGTSKYFPNVNELTIFNRRASCSHWDSTYNIDGIISMIQVTKLTIDYSHRPFNKLVDLLYCTPNVHTLVFKQLSLSETDYFLLQESEKFRLVSNQNKIKSITFSFDYSLRKIKLFMNLCPKLQQLTIGMTDSCLEIIVQFLLLETKRTTCHLSSLCIFGINTIWNKKLKTLIESKNLSDDYSIKILDRNFYLWW
ncbi:unnamed protein product [Rotaria sordida]|uniref:F-box domain-containing protein n=1 Tax=Rotaria sordida TaxID=392033 RepID=A0A815AU63_9BILA|nr:unnamed protein product [Rotaria sordida]CAF3757150.1 unnamed protein product [Rotaria sordida]